MNYNSEKIYSVPLTEREWVLITNTLWLDHNFQLSEKIGSIIEKEKNKMTGIVHWFNNQKGYGFIWDEKKNDVFMHYSGIVSEKKYKTLEEGDKVTFDIVNTEKGIQAINIKKVEK